MECERPDVGIMSLREGGSRWGDGLRERRLGRGEVPMQDGTFGTARDEQRVHRMPCHGWGREKSG